MSIIFVAGTRPYKGSICPSLFKLCLIPRFCYLGGFAGIWVRGNKIWGWFLRGIGGEWRFYGALYLSHLKSFLEVKIEEEINELLSFYSYVLEREIWGELMGG